MNVKCLILLIKSVFRRIVILTFLYKTDRCCVQGDMPVSLGQKPVLQDNSAGKYLQDKLTLLYKTLSLITSVILQT